MEAALRLRVIQFKTNVGTTCEMRVIIYNAIFV
jgi:hypothetical protein